MGEWAEDIPSKLLVGAPFPPTSIGLVIAPAEELPYPLNSHLLAGYAVVTPTGLAYLGAVAVADTDYYMLEIGNANPATGEIFPWQQVVLTEDDAEPPSNVFLTEILSTAEPREYRPVVTDLATAERVDGLVTRGFYWRVGTRLFLRISIGVGVLGWSWPSPGTWEISLPYGASYPGNGDYHQQVGQWLYFAASGQTAGGMVVMGGATDDDDRTITVRCLYEGAGMLADPTYVGGLVPEAWGESCALLLEFSVPDQRAVMPPPPPLPAPEIVGDPTIAHVSGMTGTPAVVDLPAGTAVGHMLVLFGHNSNPTYPTPVDDEPWVGPIELGTAPGFGASGGTLFWKFADADDIAAGTVSVEGGGSYNLSVILVAVAGADTFTRSGSTYLAEDPGRIPTSNVATMFGVGDGLAEPGLVLSFGCVDRFEGDNFEPTVPLAVDRGAIIGHAEHESRSSLVVAAETITAAEPYAQEFTGEGGEAGWFVVLNLVPWGA